MTNTAPTTGAADLPEALRVPLDSLHADAGYLCGRLLNGSLTQEQVVESIRRRIDAAKLAAITAQAISAEPAEHVQNPAENEHVAGDVSGNGAGLNMSTPHARITELESQLAQRFDAADMATAAAQGFRDGVASVANQPSKRQAITPLKGGHYNRIGQPERLVYMGTTRYPGDQRTWHQFAKVETPEVCWSEVLTADLANFEETDAQS